MRSPFPLQWPEGWARCTSRVRSRFGGRVHGLTFDRARREMLVELDRLGAVNVVITTDLPVRRDGMPYATGKAQDPGVAVWFALPDERGRLRERVFACDRWETHAENIHAITLSVGAIRGLDRWGASDIITRVFSGFAALPPGGGEQASTARPWRMVLGVESQRGESRDAQLAVARACHRELIREHHPDVGGSHERAAEINAALAAAEAELGA